MLKYLLLFIVTVIVLFFIAYVCFVFLFFFLLKRKLSILFHSNTTQEVCVNHTCIKFNLKYSRQERGIAHQVVPRSLRPPLVQLTIESVLALRHLQDSSEVRVAFFWLGVKGPVSDKSEQDISRWAVRISVSVSVSVSVRLEGTGWVRVGLIKIILLGNRQR